MRNLALLLLVIAAAGARAAELSPAEITKAKQLYTTKCAKCHALPDPAKYSKADLKSWMTKMAKKGRLAPEEADLLTQYAENQRASKPGLAPK